MQTFFCEIKPSFCHSSKNPLNSIEVRDGAISAGCVKKNRTREGFLSELVFDLVGFAVADNK